MISKFLNPIEEREREIILGQNQENGRVEKIDLQKNRLHFRLESRTGK